MPPAIDAANSVDRIGSPRADELWQKLTFFQQAAEKGATPRALGQLGLCEHALGLWVAADKHLGEALRHPEDSWVRKNEAALRADLARLEKNIGSIEIWGTPVGAQVSVEGDHPRLPGPATASRRGRLATRQPTS